jgi:hypothetical protein
MVEQYSTFQADGAASEFATRTTFSTTLCCRRDGRATSASRSPTVPSPRLRKARCTAGLIAFPELAVPGLPNLHCHAFQRGMAGLAERRGPTADSFWTWREVMYHFLQRLSPDDVEAIAAFAYLEMLEAGFTTVGEFHYLHHDVDGRPYANLVKWRSVSPRPARKPHWPHAAAVVLRLWRLCGAAPAPASAASSTIRSASSIWSGMRGQRWQDCRKDVWGIAPHSLLR